MADMSANINATKANTEKIIDSMASLSHHPVKSRAGRIKDYSEMSFRHIEMDPNIDDTE